MNTLLHGRRRRGRRRRHRPTRANPPPQGAGLQVFPFFHIGGLSGLYVTTVLGNKLVTMYKWDVDDGRSTCSCQGAHHEHVDGADRAAPAARVAAARRAAPRRAGRHRVGRGAGAAGPDPLASRRSSSRRSAPANGYGLTETTSAVIANSGADYFAHPDSVGRPAVGADVRVVDELGQDRAARRSIGELWVRGPNIVDGYWNKPEATAAAFTDGWFHTGDLGRRRRRRASSTSSTA